MKGFFVIGLSIVLLSCDDEDNKKPIESTIGEVTVIETMFTGKEVISSVDSVLLRELNVCDFIASDTSIASPCSSAFYKILKSSKDKVISDAFLLQVKSLTIMKGQEVALPMRHLIAFERENGRLVKVNGFRGNLIGTRESAGNVDDLIVRFFIPDEEAHFNCLFLWKDRRYRFESVEAIYGGGGNGPVKESAKEAISKDVFQVLVSNGMLF